MAEEKSESRKEALIDQVLQCQIVIARHIGLDRDVIEFLDNITDWKKREWYYLAALDGMSCQDLLEMEQKNMSISQIRKERLLYLKNLYTDHDELGEEILHLQKDIMETKTQSETLRIMIEENLEKALKREPESQKSLIEEKDQRIRFLEHELKIQRTLPRQEEKEGVLKRRSFWQKKRKKELEDLLTNEQMSEEQKDFLIDCLEEGLTPKQILEFADPNFSVNVMRRLKQLQQRGGKCGDIERIGR